MNYKEWRKYRLGDLSIKLTKGTTPTSLGFPFVEMGINFIKVESLTFDGTIDKSKFAYISEKANEKLKRSIIEEGDILFSMAGMVLGKSAVVKKEYLPANTNQALAIIRLDQNKALPKFVDYFIRQKSFFDYVNSSTGQSAQPNINLEEIGNLIVNLPNLETQKKIASILSSLDDKIELNRQTNQTLETIAQTLFKEMCLPKSEELPEGWRVGKLGDFMETVSKTHKMKQEKIIFLNTSDILEGNILHNNYSEVSSLPGQAKKSIQQNDILLSEIRPSNKRFAFVDFDGKDFVVSTKLMVLRSKGELSPYLFYCYLTSNETLNYLQHLAETRSGTFPQITFTQLEDLVITVPPQQILENLTHSVESIYKQILQNNKQNQTLISIRDSLLPKLMKGEIEV
jgi:type I restriction enzyme, S subunit